MRIEHEDRRERKDANRTRSGKRCWWRERVWAVQVVVVAFKIRDQIP